MNILAGLAAFILLLTAYYIYAGAAGTAREARLRLRAAHRPRASPAPKARDVRASAEAVRLQRLAPAPIRANPDWPV
jgi:hypothetical protein